LSQERVQLELKERLNYPYVLLMTIRNLKNALNSEYVDVTRIQIMLMDFLSDIPSTWVDEEFNTDIAKCRKESVVPIVHKFAGQLLSAKYVEARGLAKERKHIQVDYFGLKNAIINLLDRRGMLVRREKIEMSTGKNLEVQSIDDLIDELAEQDDQAELDAQEDKKKELET